MSQDADLDEKTMWSYVIKRSTVHNFSVASFPRKEESDGNGEASPWANIVVSKETDAQVPAKDEPPDGGLRAWLVVLGVRPLPQICGQSLTIFQGSCAAFAT